MALSSSVIRRDKHQLDSGTIVTPVARRRSLPPHQRNAITKPYTPYVKQDEDYRTSVNGMEKLEEPEPSTHRLVLNTQQHQNQPKHRGFSWTILFAGAIALIVLYTITFFVLLAYISVSDRLTYGPTPTSYTHTLINGYPTTIVVGNAQGSVYVSVFQTQRDGSMQTRTYSGPTLNTEAWGGDTSSIVATAEIQPKAAHPVITIHLLGSINYFRPLFTRPQMTFHLVPDTRQGYIVTQ